MQLRRLNSTRSSSQRLTSSMLVPFGSRSHLLATRTTGLPPTRSRTLDRKLPDASRMSMIMTHIDFVVRTTCTPHRASLQPLTLLSPTQMSCAKATRCMVQRDLHIPFASDVFTVTVSASCSLPVTVHLFACQQGLLANTIQHALRGHGGRRIGFEPQSSHTS